MAKRSTAKTDVPALFSAHARASDLSRRRQRALFIPRFLNEEASSVQLAGPSQDTAHAIAIRWADRESCGTLAKDKETTIDTQFLDQLFGEGLGYQLKTQSPSAWQLEHKYAVPGVGTADAALADFPTARMPAVIFELKGSQTDLDRDRSNGRTAVQQCWDYMNALPDCQWAVVSNFRTIRLYNRQRGSLVYEEFALQDLREREAFNRFYFLFERGGLLPSNLAKDSRATRLLERTRKRQKEVGDDLYELYSGQRLRLIDHLIRYEHKDLNDAIAIAQKLLDRVIFIAFCEDRDLLPEDCLERASTNLPAFSRVKNPKWHNFLGLFHAVDKGSNGTPQIERFNGGLFADDPSIDQLELDDDPWANGFAGFGRYDFSEEVNVEVLGHLFERSITELERLRVGGLFALRANIAGESDRKVKGRVTEGGKADDDKSPLSRMPKSAQRKRFGIYYTPPAFTGLIVERTVDALVRQQFEVAAKARNVDPEARENQDKKALLAYWQDCLALLKDFTVCDPACGSGAFLIRAYDALDAHYKAVVHGLGGCGYDDAALRTLEDSIPELILNHNLFGVDLSREGVEITQLALWIRSARKGKTLADLSKHIIHGNSLVSDRSADANALAWEQAFPSIFPAKGRRGFSCVIGNPPWERVKVQDREFFSLTDPDTAGAVSAADRRKRVAAMPTAKPELHASYLKARDNAQKMLDYARQSKRYPLTGKGDVNLYMLFAELAKELVCPDGLVGLLVPSGIATDESTKELFGELMDSKRLVSLYDFENKDGHFEDVHRSFKFTAIVFGGNERRTEQADFVFFARSVEDTAATNKHRHIALTAADMALLNPNTRTCPIFRTRRDADLTKDIYARIPVLIDENRKRGGNPWGIKFFTMFHQTNDAEHFKPREYWKKAHYTLSGNVFSTAKKRALPLYEAKMVQAYDHRAASVLVDDENWVRQGQKYETKPVEHQNPEFAVLPRWWVSEDAVNAALGGSSRRWLLLYKDVTSATNERTMIAALSPLVAVVNSAPVVFIDQLLSPRREACLLANFNAFAYDFVARQKVGGVHLNFFIVEQLPTLPPDTYDAPCPWSRSESVEHWISERVLKLSCTADDMIPFAQACGFKGSRGDGVHAWKEPEREAIRAELDAAYFILYGIHRPDVEYMLSTFTGTGFITPDQRGESGVGWERGKQGAMILDAYDHLTGLASGRY